MNNSLAECFPYYVGKLPFVCNSLVTPNNRDGIPNFFEFSLDVDQDTGLLVQKINDETDALLLKAYDSGSVITGCMDNNDFGNKYVEDFIDFITDKEVDLSGLKILEIGCGNGYLLNRFKLMGALVTGIEPGLHAKEGREKYSLNIISDFYPTPQITEQFDIIIVYNVLEHISDYKSFLINIQKQLKDNGRLYFSVPDCEKAIKTGDISMLIHEHTNYFTEQSMKNIFVKSIQKIPLIEKSKFASELNCVMHNDGEQQNTVSMLAELFELNTSFLTKMNIVNKRVSKFLIDANISNKTIGIYVPSRIINLISLMEYKLNYELIEFYDDNPELKNTFLPGFELPIKSKLDLIQNPKDYILIMSYSFSDKIKSNIVNEIPIKTKIVKFDDLLVGC